MIALTAIVIVVCLLGGIAMFVLGLLDLKSSLEVERKLREAAQAATTRVGTPAQPGSLEPHAGVDVAGMFDGLAKLAAALKDLDRSSRSFVLSLAFVALGALVVSVVSL